MLTIGTADRKKALEAPPSAAVSTVKRPGEIAAGRPTKTAKISKANVIPDEYLPPNSTLFVREVPDDYDVEMLEALFGRYPGFKEVRTIPLPQYKGCAFVEYEANEGAIQAREALNGRTIGENVLKVTYQKAG
jgi:RNA recognition motif-containing protein